MKKLTLYGESVRHHEPFSALDIRSVKYEDEKQDNIITCNENERSFYALYAYSVNREQWVSVADSPSKLELLELADMFNVFSSFTLPLTTKFEI